MDSLKLYCPSRPAKSVNWMCARSFGLASGMSMACAQWGLWLCSLKDGNSMQVKSSPSMLRLLLSLSSDCSFLQLHCYFSLVFLTGTWTHQSSSCHWTDHKLLNASLKHLGKSNRSAKNETKCWRVLSYLGTRKPCWFCQGWLWWFWHAPCFRVSLNTVWVFPHGATVPGWVWGNSTFTNKWLEHHVRVCFLRWQPA